MGTQQDSVKTEGLVECWCSSTGLNRAMRLTSQRDWQQIQRESGTKSHGHSAPQVYGFLVPITADSMLERLGRSSSTAAPCAAADAPTPD